MLTELWQKKSNPNGECMEVRWVKSPYSNPSGCCLEARFQKSPFSETDDCLEASFQKSPTSNGNDGCTEARWAGGWVETRNSNDPDGPVIRYTPGEWRAFLRGVRESDTFDLPADV